MIQRLHRVIREHGAYGALIHITKQLCPLHTGMVFEMDISARTKSIPNIIIMRYFRFSDIAPDTIQILKDTRGIELIHEFIRLFNIGAQLWLGFCNKTIAGICWSRSGVVRQDYFVPLKVKDANILSCFVFPQYRGHSIYPDMLKHIVNTLRDNDGIQRVFIDCKSWNYPSIRGIEKAGFRFIGQARCITLFGHVIFRHPRYILL